MAGKTFLSGIQPSGRPHLGNYFGAIRQHIALQEQPGERFYFIADYHALTSSRDPQELRQCVRETAITYLALGLDVERATLFRQSDVPEVQELTWLLACTGGMGVLERAVDRARRRTKPVRARDRAATCPRARSFHRPGVFPIALWGLRRAPRAACGRNSRTRRRSRQGRRRCKVVS